jgi:hypothetical protein
MAQPRPRFDAWPLLPRPLAEGAERAGDETLRAAATATAILAGIFLLLRHALPDGGIALEFTALVAVVACKGSFAIASSLLIMMFAAALLGPLPLHRELRHTAMLAFDHGVHLALVLTACGILALLVLSGSVTRLSLMFAAQAIVLLGCSATRLWFTRRRAASR